MRRIIFLAVCLFAAAGCSKKAEPAAGDDTGLKAADDNAPAPVAGQPAAATPEAEPEVSAEPDVVAPTVELVKPGNEPLEPLRLEVPVGTADTAKLTMAMSMGVSAQGQAMPPTALPPLIMVMKIEAVEKTDDGQLRVRSKLTGVDVGAMPKDAPPGVAEQVKAQMEKLVGLEQTGLIDTRGFLTEGKVTMPAGAPPQARQMIDGMKNSLEQFAVPVPKEPVGVGAVWKVTSAPAVNGIEVAQTVEYTLVSRKGATLELEANVTQAVKSKSIELPQLPGVAIEIEKWDGKGTGKISMSLTRLVPKASTIDVGAVWTMKANGQAATYELKNKSTLERQ